jgi:hypothetical protein
MKKAGQREKHWLLENGIANMKKPIWDNPRPKSLGKPKKLTSQQKLKAKSMVKKACRVYPNLVDNLRVVRKKK